MKSRVYSTRSNAARDAVQYGIARNQVVAVSGGYYFEAENITNPRHLPRFPIEVAPPTVESSEPDITDAEIQAARDRANAGCANGKPIDEPVAPAWLIDPPPAVPAAAKPPRKTRKPAKPKAAKTAKKPVHTATGHKTKGDPCYQGRRTAQGKRGITADLISFMRNGWRTAEECLAFTGWVSNTWRGVLSFEKKRHGFTVGKRKNKDSVTEFRIIG